MNKVTLGGSLVLCLGLHGLRENFVGIFLEQGYWELRWIIRYYSSVSYRHSFIPKYYVTRLFYNVHEM